MKKILLIFALVSIGWTSSYAHVPADSDDFSFVETHRLPDDNPRGTVTRNGVKYKWELMKTSSATKYQLKISRERGGKSNLVLSTDVIYQDKGSEYHVKMYAAKENGYKWDIDREAYLKIIFTSTSKKEVEVSDGMKKFEDNSHGFSASEFESKTNPSSNYSNTLVRNVAAACKYLIYKYPKAFKP